MKKITLILILVLCVSLLSSCGLREQLLATPDEYVIPKDSLIATCTKNEVSYTFIFKDDGVYQYAINDEIQSEEVLDIILQKAYQHDSSMAKYLEAEFDGTCDIKSYEED